MVFAAAGLHSSTLMDVRGSETDGVLCDADDERHFITHILAFFAASDGIVMENLAVRFMSGA